MMNELVSSGADLAAGGAGRKFREWVCETKSVDKEHTSVCGVDKEPRAAFLPSSNPLASS